MSCMPAEKELRGPNSLCNASVYVKKVGYKNHMKPVD